MKREIIGYKIISVIFVLIATFFFFKSNNLPKVSPTVIVKILSVDPNYTIGNSYQYRVLLPDSTIKVYKSNDLFYVGDKIKI